MRSHFLRTVSAVLGVCALLAARTAAADDEKTGVERMVEPLVRPIMEKLGIPGMAVGISVNGRSEVFYYGVASRANGQPVGGDTLFEVGSVSKTFTATLAAYAQITGRLSLSDPASKWMPALRDSAFERVNLLHLGTHTAGGMPLQVPQEVRDDDGLLRYLQQWKPAFAPGATRTYSNLSIGLLGRIAARSMDADFVALMEGKVFPALGLKNTFLRVPAAAAERYAQGYTEENAPVRIKPGVLDAETYGVRTTAADLLRFVEVNMGVRHPTDMPWQSAIALTHTGYYRVGPMTQDLIWEQYPYPVTRQDLLAGNSNDVILKPNPAVALDPPLPPQDDVLINKTGSTNGFSTYVAFVPARKIAVVMLANKRFPIDARVSLVHEILTRLDGRQP